jgi:hypothetical protein
MNSSFFFFRPSSTHTPKSPSREIASKPQPPDADAS